MTTEPVVSPHLPNLATAGWRYDIMVRVPWRYQRPEQNGDHLMTDQRWTSSQILALPMADNDAGAADIREYLTLLLLGVWQNRDAFNGKRPFGNSGWHYEIYDALADAGIVTPLVDEEGDRDYTAQQRWQMDRIIDDVISGLGATS